MGKETPTAEGYLSFRAAVFVMVFDREGRVLLHQRAGTDFLPGYYDFPSGHVEHESFTAAAVRELQEETGLHVDEAGLELAYLGTNILDQPYVNVIFRANRWSGQPQIMEPHKCSDMQFFALDALPSKLTLSVRLMAEQGFRTQTSGSRLVDLATYETLMGESFHLA